MRTIFLQTKKHLSRKFSEETIDKYGQIIGFLYQNGFELNCSDDEVEEQLSLFNFFESEEDLNDLKKTTSVKSDYSIGKKIVIEELYDIVKLGNFSQLQTENILVQKTYATSNWNKINNLLDRLSSLFNSDDSEIVGALKQIPNTEDIKQRISSLFILMDKKIKLAVWNKFKELISIAYSAYIRLSKIKKEEHKSTIFTNLNSELYGALGGYNPNTNEIICKYNGAVFDVKKFYNSDDNLSIVEEAKQILKGAKNLDETFSFLSKWSKGTIGGDEKAKQIVINCLLNGILTLISIKNNFTFSEEFNSKKEEKIKNEFLAVLKYANIPKDYLL